MSITLTLLFIVIVALASAAAALLWGRKKVQDYFESVYGVREREGIEILKSISIGGIDQWIHVRGRNKDNPILLFLHGGPCWPHIGWHDANQRPWENYFTVVQWDQRQSGKTYQSMKKVGNTLSRQQFLDDTEAVIRYIREEFGQQKIFLMGTSYGTFLGINMAKKHPDWFHAYIGVGQVSTMIEHARGEFDLLLEYAKQHDLKDLQAKLEAMEPYPDPDNIADSFFSNANILMDHSSRLGMAYPDSVEALFSMSAMGKWISPLYSLRDNLNRKFGKYFDSTHPFAEEMMTYDLPKEIGSDFDVPIFFFSGKHDFHISHRVTDPWFNTIDAPYKEQVFFNNSAHVPFQTEPGEFLIALVQKVLPMMKR
jgi:pimeloyl-ACP methyl ester carboxylesterase